MSRGMALCMASRFATAVKQMKNECDEYNTQHEPVLKAMQALDVLCKQRTEQVARAGHQRRP